MLKFVGCLNVYSGKSKVILLNGVKVYVDKIRLEHVSEFKCFGCGRFECSRKVASGRRVAGAIRSLVNARDLKL